MKKILKIFILFLTLSGCNGISHQITNNPVSDTAINKYDKLENNENKKKTDTTYIDFFSENPLQYGYRFGMTLSDWNKNLALLAQNDRVNELDKASRDNYTKDEMKYWPGENSYRGFIKIYQSDSSDDNSNRIGSFIIGLFLKPKASDDSVQVFRLNKKIIDEPILVGIKREFNIPSSDIVNAENAIINQDQLDFVAGNKQYILSFDPPETKDFQSHLDGRKVWADFDKEMDKNYKPEYEGELTTKSEYKTLLQNKLFYCVFVVEEIKSTYATWNQNYKIISITNSTRRYKLFQYIFSKRQAQLNVNDYMTSLERLNYQNSEKTKKLIDEALNK